MSLVALKMGAHKLTLQVVALELLHGTGKRSVQHSAEMTENMRMRLKAICCTVEECLSEVTKIAEAIDVIKLSQFFEMQCILSHFKDKGVWKNITQLRQRLVEALLKTLAAGDTGYFGPGQVCEWINMSCLSRVGKSLKDLEAHLPGSGYKMEVLRVDFATEGIVTAYRFLEEKQPAVSPVPSPAPSSLSDASGG